MTTDRGAQQTIYVLGSDGQPQAVQITTGDTNGTLTEVASGKLGAGMKVITGQLSGGSSDGSASGSRSGARKGG